VLLSADINVVPYKGTVEGMEHANKMALKATSVDCAWISLLLKVSMTMTNFKEFVLALRPSMCLGSGSSGLEYNGNSFCLLCI
jgi:hypothetical protein